MDLQSLGELLATVRQMGNTSPQRRRLAQVEIHKKFSIPFACFAFAVVGIPLAETARRGGKGSGLALSLAILVLYYVLISNGETWAQEGRMGPALAMWLPNLLFLMLALLALHRARRVFADAAARSQLEAILHPRIRARWQACRSR